MLGDVLMQHPAVDIAQIHTQLAGHISLHGFNAVTGDAVEADQVTEQNVVAIATRERIVARFGGLGMAENGLGQFARVDVGLRFAVGVVWPQGVGVDAVIQTDRFNAREIGQQQECLFGVDAGPIGARFRIGQLKGAIALRIEFSRGVVIGVPVFARAILGGEVPGFVDADPVVITHLVISDYVARFVLEVPECIIHRVVGVRECRVGLLTPLIHVRFAIGDEERLVATGAAGILEILEPVGRGLECIFVVGTAAGLEVVERFLQRLQGVLVGKIDRDGGVDLLGEVHQQDIHRTGLCAIDAIGQGLEHRLQGFSRRVDARLLHTARGIDNERQVVVLPWYYMQAVDVGNHDVVLGAQGLVVVLRRQVAGEVGIRVDGNRDRARGRGGVVIGLLGCSRGDGDVELAMVVGRWFDAQAVQVPAGDIHLRLADGNRVTSAIAEDRTFRNTTQLDAEFFRSVGIGQAGGNTHQLDGAVLGAFVELVALVVTFAIVAVQLADGNASIAQLVDVRVHRDVAVAQVDRRAAIDRQVDVIAARAALVGVIDVQGVVTADARRE
ncbi:hypothetical protein D3C77_313820 [compost metagenome]